MSAIAPAWQTEDLLEEWPENSPSPPNLPVNLPSSPDVPEPKLDIASIHAKRGSLRMLGTASARALPPSRSGSVGSERLISGQVEGGKGHLVSGGFVIPPSMGLPSPPTSRSSSGNSAAEGGSNGKSETGGIMRAVEEAVGTFIVKEGVEDDGRGPRNPFTPKGGAGKDIFGALALERMFEPPSPPIDTPPPVAPTESTTPTLPDPRAASTDETDSPRRLSHPYAPVRPSRLSKSVTPPSHTSLTTSHSGSAPSSRSTTPVDQSPIAEDDATVPYPEGNSTEIIDSTLERSNSQVSDTHIPDQNAPRPSDLGSNAMEASMSPDGRTKFPFTFTSPVRPSPSSLKISQSSPFAPPESDNNGEPSHSTLHLRPSPPTQQYQQRGAQVPLTKRTPASQASKTRSAQGATSNMSPNPNLRLFRNTYDTYTRDHLSAIVDSIAIEPSPSPPNSIPKDLRDWSPPPDNYSTPSGSSRSMSDRTRSDTQSGSGSGTQSESRSGSGSFSRSGSGSSYDGRSSKRLRLSPASPRRRDWGAQGRMVMDRIRGGVEDSATSGSRSDGYDGPTMDYQSIPPTPPLQSSPLPQAQRQTHRSNPSTTSSTYLATAKELMERIKSRGVSDSASGFDSSPAPGKRVLSETDDQSAAIRSASGSGGSGLEGDVRQVKGKGRAIGESPRRTLRRLSAAEEVQKAREESDEDRPISRQSQAVSSLRNGRPQPSVGGASSAATSSLTRHPQQPQFDPTDLNRYVSSSTYQTATTLSTSFVKHRGPRAAPTPMRQIKPDEVEGFVPERIGKMRFDRTSMKWVKSGGAAELGAVEEGGESRAGGSEESVDVFAGLESLGAEPSSRSTPGAHAGRRASLQAVEIVVGDHEEEEDPTNRRTEKMPLSPDSPNLSRPKPVHTSSAPAILHPTTPVSSNQPPKPFRSALRNPNSGPSLTPAGLKKKTGWHEPLTPAHAELSAKDGSSGKRSVSFSDEKRIGKIVDHSGGVDLVKSGRLMDNGDDLFKANTKAVDGDASSRSFLPSTRTRRIQNVLENMGDLSLDDGTPSKPSKIDQSIRHLPNLSLSSSSDDDEDEEDTITGPARFSSFRRSRGNNAGDATFLTECSFGVAHDRLVQLITDVQPYEPYWEELRCINLKGKGAESVARLKEFLPILDEVDMDDNFISYLSGIPSSVRTLHVAGNRLSSLTSVAHLTNLQYLDISRNQLDSVSQLECLKHLRELKADGNNIRDLSGIMGMDCLIKLSVSGNRIERVDFTVAKWGKLETLDLSGNIVSNVQDLHQLTSLSTLNLDDNNLTSLTPSEPMTSLRVLRLSNNDINKLDVALFPKIRTLFADGNRLPYLSRSSRSGSGHIEQLSLRSQRLGPGVHLILTAKDLSSSLKRLYISGNPLAKSFFPKADFPMYALTYLEMAGCNLTKWPVEFGKVAPNLNMLNVNYNFLEDLDGVRGMMGLRKLSVVGNRLGGSGGSAEGGRGAVKALKGMTSLEEVDLRMNPSTLSFYLPVVLPPAAPPKIKPRINPNFTLSPQDDKTIINPDANTDQWASLDASFRKSLPDEWYSRRLAYRGLMMASCSGVLKLDGVEISEGERKKAAMLLRKAGGM